MWQSDTEITNSCDGCQRQARSQETESIVKNEDISLYGNPEETFEPICSGTSPSHHNHRILIPRPLGEHNLNSRDSGYATTSHEDGGSMEDDVFEDLVDLEPEEDNLPQNFSKLLNGPISYQIKKKENIVLKSSQPNVIRRPILKRTLSTQEATSLNKISCSLFKISNLRSIKKTSKPFSEISLPVSSKKQKMPPVQRPILNRSTSATDESITCAVARSSEEPNLIGDYSRTYCLPLTQGRHQDLKSITPKTLARLIKGEFSKDIASFKVIDCRFPYEYEGGHIQGADNIYTQEQCMELLNNFDVSQNEPGKRNILVFHCEFSSERGPYLYRYLRQQDRQLNQDYYPFLIYPEMYLLEGGYKHFFEEYSDLCVPAAYIEMLHPEHKEELLYFRLKAKTMKGNRKM